MKTQESQLVPVAEIVDEPATAWIVATGEWSDHTPVAVVIGTEGDAQQYADRYNATHPWTCEADRARPWATVPCITPPVQ